MNYHEFCMFFMVLRALPALMCAWVKGAGNTSKSGSGASASQWKSGGRSGGGGSPPRGVSGWHAGLLGEFHVLYIGFLEFRDGIYAGLGRGGLGRACGEYECGPGANGRGRTADRALCASRCPLRVPAPLTLLGNN